MAILRFSVLGLAWLGSAAAAAGWLAELLPFLASCLATMMTRLPARVPR
jgi:hypothetical protein